MKIKINDKVKVMSGKDSGKTGKVIQAFPKEEKIVVEGVNIMKKSLKSRKQSEKGQVIELAGPLHVSKVALICPKCSLETRVGYKIEGKDKKRVCRKCKEVIE
jgi:large subunit ribosomal protein L24